VSVAFCAYPWDLIDDPDAVGRIRAAGGDGVAIAAAYHSVRAATPLHPRHRIVDATSSALYLPAREEAFGALRPEDRTPWVGPDAFARPEVRAYAAALVAETAAAADLDGVMLEACGPMGVGHLGHHEKTAGADWSADAEALLSICFCTVCVALLAAEGVDPDALRAEVRARVDGGGGPAGLEAVLVVRARARRELLGMCVEAARVAGAGRVVVHAQADPWATGPFAALLDDADLVDGVVVLDAVAHDADAMRALRERLPGTRIGGYLWALPPATPASIRGGWPAAVRGLDDTYVYHLGLVSRARLDAIGDALRAGSGPA
jgi:hypothetical protein